MVREGTYIFSMFNSLYLTSKVRSEYTFVSHTERDKGVGQKATLPEHLCNLVAPRVLTFSKLKIRNILHKSSVKREDVFKAFKISILVATCFSLKWSVNNSCIRTAEDFYNT